jgi:cell division protein FtsQ
MLKVKIKRKKIPKENITTASRKIIVTVGSIVVVVVFLVLVRNYFHRSDAFTIQDVSLKGEGVAGSYLAGELSRIGVGQNIFLTDIKRIETSIKRDYFDVKDIRVQRIFPNKLIFFVEKRKPIALIKSSYYYPVDEEGIVLREVSSSIQEPLPLIEGIHVGRRDVGRRKSSKRLTKALHLLEVMKIAGIFENHNVSKIYAPNSSNLSFYIDDGLQIKIGGEKFQERLNVFKKTLRESDIKLREIAYIDLRFKDVVIGPK